MGVVPDDELAAYVDQRLAPIGEGRAPVSDGVLVELVREHIRASLERLNNLDPGDPVWSGTNRRPTEFKASAWEARRLADDQANDEARWACVAFLLLHCQYGAEELLLPLAEREPRNLRWIVGASEWLTRVSGPDMGQTLRSALTRLTDAEQALSELRRSSDPLDQRAATIADRVRRGESLAAALRAGHA